MVCVLFTLKLPGRFFLLILFSIFLPCSKRYTIWQGNVQWNSSLSKYKFLSHLLLLLPPKTFFNTGVATSPRNGAAAKVRSPIEKPLPLYFLYSLLPLFLFFTANVSYTFSYNLFSFHSNKSLSVWLIAYVVCLKVTPFLVKI